MKTVLWISRHQMTPEQSADLGRRLGDTFVILPWTDTVTDLAALLPAIGEADVIAAVLPTALLAELLKLAGGKPVIQTVAGRIATGRTITLPDGRQEAEFRFVHLGWEVIRELRFRSEPFGELQDKEEQF